MSDRHPAVHAQRTGTCKAEFCGKTIWACKCRACSKGKHTFKPTQVQMWQSVGWVHKDCWTRLNRKRVMDEAAKRLDELKAAEAPPVRPLMVEPPFHGTVVIEKGADGSMTRVSKEYAEDRVDVENPF